MYEEQIAPGNRVCLPNDEDNEKIGMSDQTQTGVFGRPKRVESYSPISLPGIMAVVMDSLASRDYRLSAFNFSCSSYKRALIAVEEGSDKLWSAVSAIKSLCSEGLQHCKLSPRTDAVRSIYSEGLEHCKCLPELMQSGRFILKGLNIASVSQN